MNHIIINLIINFFIKSARPSQQIKPDLLEYLVREKKLLLYIFSNVNCFKFSAIWSKMKIIFLLL